MNQRFIEWFKLDQYTSRPERMRAERLAGLLLVLPVASVVLLGIDFAISIFGWLVVPLVSIVGLFWLIVLSFICWIMVRQGALSFSVNLFVVGGFIATVGIMWPYGVNGAVGAIIPITVLFAAMIARWPVALLYTVAVTLYTLFAIWAENVGLLVPVLDTSDKRDLLSMLVFPVFCFLTLGAVGMLVGNLNQMTERAERRLANANLVNRLSERLTAALNVSWLFDQALEMIFDVHTPIDLIRIYVHEPGQEHMTLAVSSDAVDEEIILQGERWQVGGPHTIGQVASMRQLVLIGDVLQEATRPGDRLLARTQAYLVLPMFSGEQLFGVMEVQSSRSDYLTLEVAENLQTVANLIAVSAEKTRRLQDVQDHLDAYEQETNNLRARLSQMEEEETRRVVHAWEAYLRELDMDESLVMDLQNELIVRESQWTRALEQAFSAGDVVALDEQSGPVIGVPIRVAGQVVGAMEFELDAPPSDEQQQMARQVGERLGLAADSSRLFAEVQRVAARESIVSEIGARLQASHTDMESALVTAAQGLSQILNVPRVSVRIGLPEGIEPDTEETTSRSDEVPGGEV